MTSRARSRKDAALNQVSADLAENSALDSARRLDNWSPAPCCRR
jgi:hypothetical protein